MARLLFAGREGVAGGIGMLNRVVVVSEFVGVNMGSVGGLIFHWLLAAGAHTEPRMEVAAAKRNRNHQQGGNEQPECAASSDHCWWEYIGVRVGIP